MVYQSLMLREHISMKVINRAVIIGLTVIVVICFLIYYFFFDISHFSGQETMKIIESDNGSLSVCVYRNNGGATTDYALLCTVKADNSGFERNIYWDYPYKDPEVSWLDDDTVIINGKTLNIYEDHYDFRRNR